MAVPFDAREVLKGKKNELRNFEKEPLQIFYVGGLGGQYQISELLEAVKDNPLCEVTVCCRQEEWENNQDILGEYCRFFNIHIIHESGFNHDKYSNALYGIAISIYISGLNNNEQISASS